MANGKPKVPPLEPEVIKNLLDRLSDEKDTEFRDLFTLNPHAALAAAGHRAPGDCLQLKDGATLASADKIKRERGKLEESLSRIFGFDCPRELKGDQ